MRSIPSWLMQYRVKRAEKTVPYGMYDYSRDWMDVEGRSALTADIAFNRHSMNDGEHVSPADNAKVLVGTDGINVRLVQGVDEEAMKRTLSRATRATIGFDLSAPEEEDNSDWEEMLRGGLQTALESQVIVFEVSGVSRTCTHQLVRSRRAAFHQQSQRASYAGDAPEVRIPESVWNNKHVRAAYIEAFMAAHKAYVLACEADISYQDARFVLPEGTTSYIMLEYPLREFLSVYAYRACSMFQWEIVAVMRKCRDVLLEAHPWLEPYVKISCETTASWMGHADPNTGRHEVLEHHCTFQGWESVEGQCDFPWAKDRARTFKPTVHQIKRKEEK